jgi:hypothetical protein
MAPHKSIVKKTAALLISTENILCSVLAEFLRQSTKNTFLSYYTTIADQCEQVHELQEKHIHSFMTMIQHMMGHLQ